LPGFAGPLVDNAMHYQQALRAKDFHMRRQVAGQRFGISVFCTLGKRLTGFSDPILSSRYTNGVRGKHPQGGYRAGDGSRTIPAHSV